MVLESKALKVNLEATAVKEIRFDPRYHVLRQAVWDYKGVVSSLDHLLFELHHPFLNLSAVVNELRGFSLKNLNILVRSPKGSEAIDIIFSTFFDLATRAPKDVQRVESVDGLLAFVEKIVQTIEPEKIAAIAHPLRKIFQKLNGSSDDIIRIAARSYHPIPTIIERLVERMGNYGLPDSFWQAAGSLLIRILRETYRYWLSLEDPSDWLQRTREKYSLQLEPSDFEQAEKIFSPVCHEQFRAHQERLRHFENKLLDVNNIISILELPGFLDIVRHYRKISNELSRLSCPLPIYSEGDSSSSPPEINLYLLFLFHMVEMEGLSHVHEEILRQLNRTLLCFVRTADFSELKKILPMNFELLKQQVGHFPRTALQCIEVLGTEVFRRDNFKVTELFLEEVVHFGFQPPAVQGVDTEWHVLSNPAHLQNIRVWLKLIGLRPKYCGILLSALIINLKLCGTCIRDTDLFQKDVSKLLNCDIEPVYNLVKQLAKGLPVYFNEIGAEGVLRDVSTELDEISHRRDRLIHFLRKQSHVESNNLIVDFIEAIFCFWYSRDKQALTPFLPPEVLDEIPVHGQYIDHVHKLIRQLALDLDLEPFARRIDRLLNLSDNELARILESVTDVPPQERRRLKLLIQMYRLETLKYKLGTQEICHHLEEAKELGFEGLDQVIEAIKRDDPEECIDIILDQLEYLKSIILSEKQFEARENIYHKRHIAADIPSMYGRYHEPKFDALSLTFRLENLANIYFERLIASMDIPFITSSTFVRILRYLRLFWRAVQLNGVYSKKFATYLSLLEKSLEVRGVTFSQYMDIIRGLSEGVQDMIETFYINPHQQNLSFIISNLNKKDLLPKYRSALASSYGETDFIHQVSERVLRDLISSSFGLQYLDNFISRLYQILEEEREVLDNHDLDLLLSYDPDEVLCPIQHPSSRTKDLMHLGNKGYNLVLLDEAYLPVPPGVIVTTEVFRCHNILAKFPNAYDEFKGQLKACLKDIEKRSGRRFGDPSNPLLLSVRSGAAISMPGMMSTVINVGSTLETIEGLSRITGKKWFAWDNYRRFLQSWAMSFGMKRESFTELMKSQKKRLGVENKREFTGEQMKQLALAYRQAILDNGIPLEDDPFKQLLNAIELVLSSWNSDKARAYREIMDISDYWGTAVIIQTMTYGNLSEQSGTGVVFTANPTHKLNRVSLWGDFTPGNQGEDIVSGLVTTFPISIEQKEVMGLDSEPSMEEMFPEIYNTLLDYAKRLIYERKWNHQEIEFTFEGPSSDKLFILQTRDMTTKKRSVAEVFVPTKELESSYLGRGIGVGGGALSGKAVFTLADIEHFREREPETSLILIRSDTVPDDIKEISMSDGLLTAKGGQTSHAAIVAFRLDKTCVVGCKQLKVVASKGRAEIHGRVIGPGDFISIDGRTGYVYAGKHLIQKKEEAYFAA